MRRRKSQPTDPKTPDLYRAPIISERLIIREATRSDAPALESTMAAAGLAEGERTADGARRFGAGHAEVPMWTATRAVCEKGSARVVGGVVLTEVDVPTSDAPRIGWWLDAEDAHYAGELVEAVVQRLHQLGAEAIVMQVRVDDEAAIAVAEAAGFRRGDAVRHTNQAGVDLDFWQYSRP
jgi:RimJ/RimL family protein N-acetyltransferase